MGVKPLPKHDRFGRLIPQSYSSILSAALKHYYTREIVDLLNSENILYKHLSKKV